MAQIWARQKCDKAEENGFSLVELMVVIFILGLITTVVVINVLPNQEKAMVQKAKADIAVLSTALESYKLDNMTYPSQSEGLNALITPPANEAGGYRRGGYIKKLPNDPWGRAYQYRLGGNNGEAANGGFEILSLGADGAPGGQGENADIIGN
ncbi:type II secretion system protein GspG [Sphingorhabdus lutea]|uniref:Type II secretion system core protein G n=1 Tax=Sphingorhabdus lutea TaxID=1913578 RepID=A0A1L3JEH3_9SPHN|nr:type II secretion system protein GspG [Sphingorhabdus lutea]